MSNIIESPNHVVIRTLLATVHALHKQNKIKPLGYTLVARLQLLDFQLTPLNVVQQFLTEFEHQKTLCRSKLMVQLWYCLGRVDCSKKYLHWVIKHCETRQQFLTTVGGNVKHYWNNTISQIMAGDDQLQNKFDEKWGKEKRSKRKRKKPDGAVRESNKAKKQRNNDNMFVNFFSIYDDVCVVGPNKKYKNLLMKLQRMVKDEYEVQRNIT